MAPWEAARRYLPALLRAAVITIVLSCLSMALAVVAGRRSSRPAASTGTRRWHRADGYVELIRGTPLLLQLFVLYFGLAAVVRLPAFLAALFGLGLNYAAYESEIYRGALEAVPTGQLEAARTLGFSERQILVLVRAPQAFRLALAPMTNDFVALLKDCSLVSVSPSSSSRSRRLSSPPTSAAGSCRHHVRRALSGDVASAVAAGAPHRAPVATGMTVLEVRSLEVRRGTRTVVAGASFAASRGEILALMGASGAGKTTILRAIAGLDPIAQGQFLSLDRSEWFFNSIISLRT